MIYCNDFFMCNIIKSNFDVLFHQKILESILSIDEFSKTLFLVKIFFSDHPEESKNFQKKQKKYFQNIFKKITREKFCS